MVVSQWLKEKLAGSITNAVKWNFTKFLCDKDGIPYKRYAPNVPPSDILPDIAELTSNISSNDI